MPSKFRCADYRKLSDRVVQAIREVYRIRSDQRPAKEKMADLDKARMMQRAAERELREHVKQHGCSVD